MVDQNIALNRHLWLNHYMIEASYKYMIPSTLVLWKWLKTILWIHLDITDSLASFAHTTSVCRLTNDYIIVPTCMCRPCVHTYVWKINWELARVSNRFAVADRQPYTQTHTYIFRQEISAVVFEYISHSQTAFCTVI